MKKKTYFYEIKSLELNVLSIVILLLMILNTYILLKVFNKPFDFKDFNLALLLTFPYLMLHEILHSIGYVINGAKFKNITYGIHLEDGILCCSCKQEIKKRNVLISLMYPFIFIGVITYMIGIIINSSLLIMLSIINITGCIGDLFMFFNFLRIKNFTYFEYDNPLAFGINTTKKMDNVKMIGLKQIKENNFKQSRYPKINVSSTSIILILVYYLLIIVTL